VLLTRDLTVDGAADLLVGAPGHGPGRAGAVYLFEGQATASCKLAGSTDGGEFGRSLAEAGDVEPNRWTDVVVGAPAPGRVAATGEGAGEVFLLQVLR
jgi:hypothetical protein